MERLQKTLAAAGVASRRHAERLIREGRVRVNGDVVITLGVQVDPATDVITVDGAPIQRTVPKRYLALHKPVGVLTTVSDPFGRPTVLDLIADQIDDDLGRVFPIGRLDHDSEGLLLLTNDGALAHRVTHPSVGVEKAYHVLARGAVTEAALRQLATGVLLDDGVTAPAAVRVLPTTGELARLQVIIHEGRKRQVRRMMDAVGLRVERLIRVRVGPVRLGDLPVGQARALTDAEVAALFRAVGLPAPTPSEDRDGNAHHHRHRRPQRRWQKRRR